MKIELSPVEAAPVEAAPVEAAPAAKTNNKEKLVEAFVLLDCVFGTCGTLISLSKKDAETGKKHGMLDLHPETIKAVKAAQ